MAEIRQQPGGLQNTGNPALDSTVNLLMHSPAMPVDGEPNYEAIKKLHAVFLELVASEKEAKQAAKPEPISLQKLAQRQ